MRFGFMEDFRNPVKWRRPFPEFYDAILTQIVRGEELGYDNVWLTEHHFTDDGYNPALLPTASAISTRTERIRIGSFILLLPYQHPVRTAEDVACIDIFSNGRFDLGIGQGYSHHEWRALCMDRSTRGERMREGIEIIKRLYTEDTVTLPAARSKTVSTNLDRCSRPKGNKKRGETRISLDGNTRPRSSSVVHRDFKRVGI
jgi:alkanesulfonate monooxygenase SsuD/methylene tetrahydromethanopterin reductase-like flavin-dependent oxidoreductase (luciferase family)